jgi:hypothetical protein
MKQGKKENRISTTETKPGANTVSPMPWKPEMIVEKKKLPVASALYSKMGSSTKIVRESETKHEETASTARLPSDLTILLLIRGIYVGTTSELGWLTGLVRKDMWAESLYFLCYQFRFECS